MKKQTLGGATTWVLEAPTGPHQLTGAVDTSLAGRRVEVEGQLAEAQFGFAMTGPVIAVRSMRALS